MTIPERIDSATLDDCLEVMTKAVFQAGMRWSMIDKKWPAFRKAFLNFDIANVAKMTDKDVRRLSEDEGIIRSPKKIEGTIHNAKTLLQLDAQYNGFRNYLQSFDSYDALSADIKRRFAFMGEMNVYYFLFRIREPVPPFDEWIETIPGEHPRMREMVEQAAQEDKRKIAR